MSFEINIHFDNASNYNFDGNKIEIITGTVKLLATSTGTPQAELYAKLDENQGLVALDSSGNSRHGALRNAWEVTGWQPGKIGSGLEGNNNGWVDFNNILGYEYTAPFSLEFWIKFTSTISQTIISKQEGAGNFTGYGINVNNGYIRVVIRANASEILSIETNTAKNDNIWHHVVMTYDGSNTLAGLKLYVDNVEDNGVIANLPMSSSILTTNDFQISGRGGSNILMVAGTVVDEVVVYQRELTPAEVAFRWNIGNGTQELPGGTVSFPTDNPPLRLYTSFFANSLISVSATTVESGSDEVRYVIIVDGKDYWWNGAVWAESSGYAETNTLSEINTNASSLLADSRPISIKFYLHSNDGTTTPEVGNIIIEFDNTVTPVTDPNITRVFGVARKPDGSFSSEIFTVQPSMDGIEYSSVTQIRDDIIYITPDENSGEWEVNLIDNDEAEVGSYYIFRFGNRFERKIVPKTNEIEYNNLEDYTE